MGDEWDDEDFEPDRDLKKKPTVDRWDGEDEDDVKDNWEDEDGEEKDVEKSDAATTKKKKPLKERIAEKEEKRRQELEEKRRQEEEARRKLTPEEMLSEKLRQQKLQEDSDLEIAKEALGVTSVELNKHRTGLDALNPETLTEFEEFETRLKNKILQFENSQYYLGLLDSLFRDVAAGLEADDVKKLGSTLNTMASEKSKAQKSKGKKKGKGKATINAGKAGSAGYNDDLDEGGYDEFDDFI